MAVQIFCSACKTSNGLSAKSCSTCGKPFGRDRRYRVCVSVKGQRVSRVVDNLTIARQTEAAIKGDLIRGEFKVFDHQAKKAVTLGNVWDRYLEWAKTNKGKSWQIDVFFYRKHLKPRFGAKALESISAFDIERLKSDMKHAATPQGKKGYSDATIRHVLVILGHLYRKATEWRLYTGENPTRLVRKPKLNNKVTEFLTGDEMQRLLDTLESWPCRFSADFVRIALFTGFRKSEILKLRWDAVNLERKAITLRDPKGGRDEVIPVSDLAVSVFKNIEKSSEYVFPGTDGQQRKTFTTPWHNIRVAARLPEGFRFHGLRHNFASHLVSNGVDLYTVSKLMSHKDVKTSQRYAHLSDQRLREAAQVSGQLLGPKGQNNVVALEQD